MQMLVAQILLNNVYYCEIHLCVIVVNKMDILAKNLTPINAAIFCEKS